MKLYKYFAITALLLLCSFDGVAQKTLKFGNIDSQAILKLMPEYDDAQKQVSELKAKYDLELNYINDEYSQKYDKYVEQRDTLPTSIRERRVQEIKLLEQEVVRVQQLANKEIHQLQQTLTDPLVAQIKNAVFHIGMRYEYTYIFDLSVSTIPCAAFCGISSFDITPEVKKFLNIQGD